MNLLLPGVYVATESPLHRLDPRVKMGAATLLTVLPFVAPSLPSALLLSACVVALAFLARVPALALLRTLRTVFWIGFVMFFFYAFTTPGQPLLSLGSIHITWAGLAAGLTQIYRLCYLVIVSSLLTYCTSPTQLAHGLEALLAPLTRIGFPVRELALVLTIALRFVPTLSDEVEKIAKAQQSRGARVYGNPIQRMRSWVPMFVPIFVAAFRRADQLATAMEARGFRGASQRTRLYQLRLSRRDLIASLVVLAVGLAIAVMSHL